MYRVGGHFGVVEIEHPRQNLEREAGGNPGHALVHSGEIAVFLIALGLGVGVLEVVAIVDAHLGIGAGVLRFLQPREHRKTRQHFQRTGGARRFRQRAVLHQLLVDFHLFGHAQAIRHLDDIDAVEERLVVLVVAERRPLRLVAVRQYHAVERNRAEALGAFVVAFLRGGQQRVQHLDRRLEHFDEFHQALVGEAQATGKAVGIHVVLRVFFQLADIHLAHQRGDVLVILVARLGLGNAHLTQHRRPALDHAKLGDVAVVFVQALDRPR